jgi:hypothetical protein
MLQFKIFLFTQVGCWSVLLFFYGLGRLLYCFESPEERALNERDY